MKILVVDDHALVREGLRQLLKNLGETVEVLEAASCVHAFELAAMHIDLDLVLLDYHLPDMDGLNAVQIFSHQHPELPIVMLSGSINPQVSQQVIAQGAAAFVTKSGRTEELLRVIQQVLDGEVPVPASIPEPVNSRIFGSNQTLAASTPPLTPRQQDVLRLLLDGYSNKEIGRELDLSDETVKNHVTAVLRGFGVQTRTQAVLAARRQGLFL